MRGIICSFYEHGTCISRSPVMTVPDALQTVMKFEGNESVIVVGTDSETGEALLQSAYGYHMYEQDGIPILRR